MRHHREPTPRRHPARRLLFGLWACLVLALTLGATPPPARASCSACGPPTAAQIMAAPAFALDVRGGVRDYYEISGGNCDVAVSGVPRVVKVGSWLALRGVGEVWNCPHSKSADTITASVSRADSKTWTLSSTLGAKVGAFGVGLETKLVKTVSSMISIRSTTSISKVIHPAYCVRLPWQAWFEVARYSAEVEYEMTRRFAWWTKNVMTGSTVHRSGNLWIACGSGTATLDMHAPINGHFRLSQRACSDVECKTVKTQDLGFFPPLKNLPTPSLPDEEDDDPSDDEPSDEATPPDDAVPPSSELPDPPAGIPDPPPGFETDDDEEGTP